MEKNPSLNRNIRVIYLEMYIAQTSLLSIRAELSPELSKGLAVFRHATSCMTILFGGESKA
jgi:hypothetical protein